ARPRQTLDITGGNRVADTREHDGHGAGRLQQWREGGAGGSQDDLGRERDQFGRVFTHGVGLAVAPAVVDADVLPDSPARLRQALRECRQTGLSFGITRGEWRKHADPPAARAPRTATRPPRPQAAWRT